MSGKGFMAGCVRLAAAMLLCVGLAFGVRESVRAVPALPGSRTIQQPGGGSFTGRVGGDERFTWTEDENGQLVQRDSGGWWHYVTVSEGELALGAIVGERFPETGETEVTGRAAEAADVAEESARAAYYALSGQTYAPMGELSGSLVTPNRIAKTTARRAMRFASTQNAEKSIPLLVIVIGFSDVAYKDAYDWGETIFEGKGSLTEYYSSMSGGRFTFLPASESSAFGVDGNTNIKDQANDGVIHVCLSRKHGNWYDMTTAGSNNDFLDMLVSAVKAADGQVDFASYDTNGNGLIETNEMGLAFVAAGYEGAAAMHYGRTGYSYLWSHAWNMSGDDTHDPAKADGVTVDSYIAMAEEMEQESGILQEPTGVLFHELGHYLGLPDLYDVTDNMRGRWQGYDVGELSLMSAGSWCKDPDTGAYVPASMDAWSRYVLGWTDPEVVSGDGTYQLSSQESEEGYRELLIPMANPGEYYLLEIRIFEGQDSPLKGTYTSYANGGIVIWHIDKSAYLQYYADNLVNSISHRPSVMPMFAEYENGSQEYLAGEISQWVLDNTLPFYTKNVQEQLMNSRAIPLVLYGTGQTTSGSRKKNAADSRGSRTYSGITLQVGQNAAREMDVTVSLPDSGKLGSAAAAYPYDAKEVGASGGSLGQLAAAALRAETESAVAMLGAGEISGGLEAGTLTAADIQRVIPGKTRQLIYSMTGQQLRELLEYSAEYSVRFRKTGKAQDGIYPIAFSGISCTVDLEKENGSRVSNIAIIDQSGKSQALSDKDTYRVAVSSELAAMETAYPVFAQTRPENMEAWGYCSDALRSFVQKEDWETLSKNSGTLTWIGDISEEKAEEGSTEQGSETGKTEESSTEKSGGETGKEEGSTENSGGETGKTEEGTTEQESETEKTEEGSKETGGETGKTEEGTTETGGETSTTEEGTTEQGSETGKTEEGTREQGSETEKTEEGTKEQGSETGKTEEGTTEQESETGKTEEGTEESSGETGKTEEGTKESGGETGKTEEGTKESGGETGKTEEGTKESGGETTGQENTNSGQNGTTAENGGTQNNNTASGKSTSTATAKTTTGTTTAVQKTTAVKTVITVKKGTKKVSKVTVKRKKKLKLKLSVNTKATIKLKKLTAKQKKKIKVTLKNNKLIIKGKKKGKVTIKLVCGGVVKKITVTVK